MPALTIVLLTAVGCTAVAPPSQSPTSAAPADAPAEAADASEQPDSSLSDDSRISPEQAFRAWLAASRVPDTDIACDYLSDALVERMLAEMAAEGIPVTSCAEMITATAALYKAFGDAGEVEVDTLSETETDALLHVTYLSGDCGSVALERNVADWTITEQSEDEC